MDKNHNSPSWLVYERCVASFLSEQNPDLEITVLPNVKLLGKYSQIERQIDVLVESRWKDGVDRRIIVDAKERKRPLDVKDVESFEGMMKDCGANRGIIVCTNGYSEGAWRRAQDAITINILTITEVEQYKCMYEPCLGMCSAKRGHSQRGMVLWSAYLGIPSNMVMHIFQTGKCDGCHSFHVWCWECGLKFAIQDNGVFRCTCNHDWISWLDKDKGDLFLMLRMDEEYGAIIDRRPVS